MHMYVQRVQDVPVFFLSFSQARIPRKRRGKENGI